VTCHYEVELALVMGKRFRNSPKEADSYLGLIHGYAIAIDLTARNLQDEAKKAGLPWDIAKGMYSSSPTTQFSAFDLLSDIR
jgi:acylpyruvate hydrolase